MPSVVPMMILPPQHASAFVYAVLVFNKKNYHIIHKNYTITLPRLARACPAAGSAPECNKHDQFEVLTNMKALTKMNAALMLTEADDSNAASKEKRKKEEQRDA